MSYNRKKKVYEGCVYLYTNKLNGMKYVGQTTVNVRIRNNQHSSKGRTHFDAVIRKYGIENFELKIIYETSDPDLFELKRKLDAKERAYIEKYNSLIPRLGGNGYNIDKGGQSNNVFGKSVDVYNMFGELVATYDSKTEASIKTGANTRQIYDLCHGVCPNYKNLCVFRFAGEPFDRHNVFSATTKHIYQFSLGGNVINEYFSLNEAYKATGLDFIGDVLDDPHRTAGNSWWGSSNEFKYDGCKKKPVKAVVEYDLWGNEVNRYSSLSECSAHTTISRNAITNSCEDYTVCCENNIFVYDTETFDEHIENHKDVLLDAIMFYEYPVNRYSPTGEYLSSYPSIAIAFKNLKYCKKREILQCCLHERKLAANYVWRFAFEERYPTQPLELETSV